MRNLVLTIAMAFAIAAPCAAASAQSMQGYIKTEGTKQGKYKNNGTANKQQTVSPVNPNPPKYDLKGSKGSR